jgi:hypothetical protein
MLNTNLQNSIDFNGQKFYVGLDVHKSSWAVTIRSLGIQVARFTQPPSAEGLMNYRRTFREDGITQLMRLVFAVQVFMNSFVNWG